MAEFKKGVKWLLFFSSYIPLFLILALKHREITTQIPNNMAIIGGEVIPIVSIFWLILSAASGIFLKITFELRRSRGGEKLNRIQAQRNRDDLITNYILVYIFPFVVLDFAQLTNWIAFVLFFIVIGIVQVRSNQLYVNPVLSLFNYRIYEVDTEDEKMTILTKGELKTSEESVKTVEISNNVHLKL